jgi:hypothetical protein
VRRLDTAYSTLVWSADGSQVTKSRPSGPIAGARFANELRVNRLLLDLRPRPPVGAPALLDHDERMRTLTFAVAPGQPLGPKYPAALAADDIAAMAGLARALGDHQPRRRWLRRLRSARRVELARRHGLLDAGEAAALTRLAARVHTRRAFAHGDLTARNVLRHDGGVALIDWEWAGLYPPGYDLAFLWFSLGEVAGGRAEVERHVDGAEASFFLSALLIELWHLQWFVPAEFRDRHLATRDLLVRRLLG